MSLATVYLYEAPPLPEAPPDDAIVVPEEEGTPVTVFTHLNGMTTYLHRELHDRHAADRLAAFLEGWLNSSPDNQFIGLPNSQYPETSVWFPRHEIEQMMHLHDAVVKSPIAVERSGGKVIHVPMGDGTIPLSTHGPGKRRR